MLDKSGDLAIAELAFFAPALLISIFVLIRHGFARQLGWFYLTVLSLLRLIGASCLLYAETSKDDSPSLLSTAAITSAIGLGPLLLATMGFLERINHGMEQKGVVLGAFLVLHLVALVAVIIAVVGGTNRSDSDPHNVRSGQDYLRASSILFLAVFLGLAAIAAINAIHKRWVLSKERKLLLMVVLALPFLFIRTLYIVLVSFSSADSIFAYGNPNIWIQAFMRFLMEAIIVAMFIVAGLLTPKVEPRGLATGVELQNAPSRPSQTGYINVARPTQAPYKPKHLGDYRPSRLMRNALQERH